MIKGSILGHNRSNDRNGRNWGFSPLSRIRARTGMTPLYTNEKLKGLERLQ